MRPQWPCVVWATTLQFPSNGSAIADGMEQMVAEAVARAKAQMRLPIMGVLYHCLGGASVDLTNSQTKSPQQLGRYGSSFWSLCRPTKLTKREAARQR